jgi:hypothetical protein
MATQYMIINTLIMSPNLEYSHNKNFADNAFNMKYLSDILYRYTYITRHIYYMILLCVISSKNLMTTK